MRMRIGTVFLALVFSAVASAQDFASEKKKLLADFRELPKLAEAVRYNEAEYDSLEALNARLKKRLLAITSKYPNSIKDDFAEFDDAPLAIHTSPDGKLRIYTWDDETGDYDFRHLHDTYFKYDRKTKTISFPLVDDDYKVTEKKIRYRFNGKCFEKINR